MIGGAAAQPGRQHSPQPPLPRHEGPGGLYPRQGAEGGHLQLARRNWPAAASRAATATKPRTPARFAQWGFDFLKYDWCSYGHRQQHGNALDQLQRPYRLMWDELQKLDRDVVFNLCQYGMG